MANFGAAAVSVCAIDATTGALSNCANSGATGLNSPTDVVIKGSNAYIVNFSGSSIARCTVDATTGALSACADAGATGLNSPIGMEIRENTAYITNNADNSISQCAIDGTTGNLSCSSGTKYLGLGLSSPYGIASNGVMLYIISQGANATLTAPFTQSKVTRCEIDPITGNVLTTSCAAETQFPLAGATEWYQTNRIAFKDNRAYLTNRNTGKVMQCDTDASTGAFTTCAASDGTFTSATGIAIK